MDVSDMHGPNSTVGDGYLNDRLQRNGIPCFTTLIRDARFIDLIRSEENHDQQLRGRLSTGTCVAALALSEISCEPTDAWARRVLVPQSEVTIRAQRPPRERAS
jgi:hypothetical protein